MKITRIDNRVLAVTLLAACLAGCGGGSNGPQLHPVTGTVTFQGAPVGSARITFIPEKSGGIATAMSDSSGKFIMKTGGEAGVAAGSCKVTVALSDAGAKGGDGLAIDMKPEDMQKLAMEGKLTNALQNAAKGSLLPAKYNKIDSTPLTVEVKAGNNDIPLALTE